jgi:hypothetical protein
MRHHRTTQRDPLVATLQYRHQPSRAVALSRVDQATGADISDQFDKKPAPSAE